MLVPSSLRLPAPVNLGVRFTNRDRMTTTLMNCPLCNLPNNQIEVSDHGERISLYCRCCGKIRITKSATQVIHESGMVHKFSAWTRNRTDTNATPLEINKSNLSEIINGFNEYSVIEKQNLLLNSIARKSDFPGESVNIEPAVDYPMAWCRNDQEFTYHLTTLSERGLIKESNQGPGKIRGISLDLCVTSSGWTQIEAESKNRAAGIQAFVAMAFAEEMNSAWDQGIKMAIEAVGYKPMRIDAQPTIDRIDVQIMSEIKKSRFIVADVTLQRPGVYFEAGYAIGLGMPVYWCVRKDELEKVHFDTRQYSHIVWETPDDLKIKLQNFIYAISGPATILAQQ